MKRLYLLLTLTILLPVTIYSQTLGEMSVQTIPQGEGIQYIVRSSNESILIVHSTLPRLSFEANMGIIRVDNPDPGEYRVHLPPGTNIVTFKADGYLPVSERYYIAAKSYAEVRVFPKSPRIITADRPELILKYTPASPDEKIRGSLDGDVLNLNFSSGQVILRPTAGRHTLKLNNAGKVWEANFDLIDGKTVIAEVEFPETATEIVTEDNPGSLYITSQPPGAKVFMNQVDQGITPLTMEDVPPGIYSFNLVRPLYLPEEFSLEVRPLEYTTHHIELTSNFGKVTIETEPAGAMVYLNGEEKGITPLTLPQLSAGSHRLRIVRSFYYETEDEFKINSGDNLQKSYRLSPRFGRASITSDPAGAEVLIDGQSKGFTPVTVEPLSSGSHIVTLKLDHYNELVDEIRISIGDSLKKYYKLKANFGELSIVSEPPGAMVIIDHDTLQGIQSPAINLKLDPGEHWIGIAKNGYETYDELIMMALGEHVDISVQLIRQTGIVKVNSEPQGARIYLNGEKVGETPVILHDVPTGEKTIRIDLGGYDIIEEQIIVETKLITSVRYALSSEGTARWKKRRNKVVLLSALLPGGGQVSQRKILRGGGYLFATVYSIYRILDAQEAHEILLEDYEDQQRRYRESIYAGGISSNFAKLQNTHNNLIAVEEEALYFSTVIAIVYGVQLLDSWFFGGGKRPMAPSNTLHSQSNIQSKLSFGNDAIYYGVTINFGGDR